MKSKRPRRIICADPNVCHVQPTFRGRRILVSDVLDLVAAGMDWDDIIKECHGGYFALGHWRGDRLGAL